MARGHWRASRFMVSLEPKNGGDLVRCGLSTLAAAKKWAREQFRTNLYHRGVVQADDGTETVLCPDQQ